MDVPLVLAQASPTLGSDVLGIANLAGYAALAVILIAIIREGFKAWREGAFVPKAQHDEVVKAGLDRETRLQAMVDTLTHQQAADTEQMKAMAALMGEQSTTLREITRAVQRLRQPKDPA